MKGPIMSRLVVENRYYKSYSDEPERTFISGLPLPQSDNGVVRNVQFIGCDFHPACRSYKFENCEFIGCSGDDHFDLIGPNGIIKVRFSQRWEPDKMSPGAKRIIELSEQD